MKNETKRKIIRFVEKLIGYKYPPICPPIEEFTSRIETFRVINIIKEGTELGILKRSMARYLLEGEILLSFIEYKEIILPDDTRSLEAVLRVLSPKEKA